ncbi:gamma-glutamyltranspeptidase [Calidifontibacter sp. DB0510]|uniref:Gamma-glutamyltranspeptidase n=1 Tax=Metallococcus carri TaxID=1656884 RepID=A0A967B126_9MICO|nr:gamma-glutamyltransferase [Metallococcus carri]NHN56348.1 gamma-glutamyltranspeptidase [Metallococcus carri]NOP35972.1 gamma-glutamyltranspeptidase [Calidifontibacter sp. DB2511S]
MPTRRVAVAAPNALAAQAGSDITHLGGSPVDAAIAAMLVTYVSEPGVVSALGGAFVNVWPADGDPVVIDANCEMPGRGLPQSRFGHGMLELNLAYGGGITIFAGAGSAATPGAFAGFAEAHRRFGQVPWRAVCEPAINVARQGYRLGSAAASYLQIVGEALFGFDPQTRAAYFVDDAPADTGALMRSPELADALEVIATQGVSALYGGELGRALADQMDAEGGLITLADLTAYRPIARRATQDALGEWRTATNPPPSIGGPVLATMLRLLQRRGSSPEEILRIQREVGSYRSDRLDVAEDLEAAGVELLKALEGNDLRTLPTSKDTAHVSVVDSDGMACAVTSSAGYSSGITVPGTGLVLNNCLGEPELNRRGFHALPPGTRIASNMAPTTARHRDGRVLAVGSPGADRITTALMQVLAHYCLEERPLQESVDAPRLHVRPGDAFVIDTEPYPAAAQALSASDATIVEHDPHSMYFGGVGAATLLPGGELQAAADPRRAAATAVG